MPSQHLDSDDPLNELAGLLKPVLEAACPAGGGGYGGCLHADLSLSVAVEAGLDARFVRKAAGQAARLLGWKIETSLFGHNLVVIDRRDPPAPFDQILEADMQRRTREAVLAVGNGTPVPAPNLHTTSAALAAVIDPWYSTLTTRACPTS